MATASKRGPEKTSSKSTYEVPSQVDDKYWLYSKKSQDYSREDDPVGGKWCVFVPRKIQNDGLTTQDHAWFAMERASHKEDLFYKFKSSTSMIEPHSIDKNNNTGCIIVYTKDFQNIEEVKKSALDIRRCLTKFSFMNKLFLHYKTNFATEARMYPSQNIKGVSIYRQTPDGNFFIRKNGKFELYTERTPLPPSLKYKCDDDSDSDY